MHFYNIEIEAEEKNLKNSLKQAAKKPGNIAACKTMAKELLHSRKAKDRLYTSKAQINSVSMQLQNQLCLFIFCIFLFLYQPLSKLWGTCKKMHKSWV